MMKVKVNITGKGTEEDPYRPDINISNWRVIEYNYKERWAIIEISKEDYEKIKDKVLEVLEQ